MPPLSVGPKRASVLQPKPAITPIRPPGRPGVFPLNRGASPHQRTDVFKMGLPPGGFMSGQPAGASPTAVTEALMAKGTVAPTPIAPEPFPQAPEPEFSPPPAAPPPPGGIPSLPPPPEFAGASLPPPPEYAAPPIPPISEHPSIPTITQAFMAPEKRKRVNRGFF
jgi:hypothetical protein